MATTGVDFVLQSKSGTNISGSTVRAAPYVLALEPNAARTIAGRVPGGVGSGVLATTGIANNGNFLNDGFATEGFALNGCAHVTTSGTTAVTLDLTTLATNTTTQVGDTAFAKWMKIKVYNCGAAAMTIAPGATNPANLGLAGTTPTLSVAPGSFVILENPAGATVDATHKTITITPSAGGDVLVGVGGA